jgi:hypothetical protein
MGEGVMRSRVNYVGIHAPEVIFLRIEKEVGILGRMRCKPRCDGGVGNWYRRRIGVKPRILV